MIFRDDALAAKRILVTGGSSGIGSAAAQMLAAAGASVIVVGRDHGRLQSVLAGLPGTSHRLEVGDISTSADAHDLLVRVSKDSGPLDGVFHSAGAAAIRLARMINEDHVRELFGAAVEGAFGIAKAGSKKSVLNDGGSIVLMSSVAGQRGKPGMVAYSAAKAALGGLTRSLAAELAPRRIRVNEIISGAVETPMHASIVQNLDEAGVDAYRGMHPLGFGKPADVAGMVTYLMTEAADWVTGATIAVDGGYTAI